MVFFLNFTKEGVIYLIQKMTTLIIISLKGTVFNINITIKYIFWLFNIFKIKKILSMDMPFIYSQNQLYFFADGSLTAGWCSNFHSRLTKLFAPNAYLIAVFVYLQVKISYLWT